MRLFSWLSSFQKSLNRGRARHSRRSIARLERLEDRLVPAAVSVSDAGFLLVTADAGGDTIVIVADGGSVTGNVKVNGNVAFFDSDPNMEVRPRDITAIRVVGDLAGSNSINLSAVTAPGFTQLVILQGTGARALITIMGGAGDDNIVGSTINDLIQGDDGNDTIDGLGGNDLIQAGLEVSANDDDSVTGGTGFDTIRGGDGNDTLTGGDDSDTVFGEAGSDSLFGGDGNDRLEGGADADIIDGGAGGALIREYGSDAGAG